MLKMLKNVKTLTKKKFVYQLKQEFGERGCLLLSVSFFVIVTINVPLFKKLRDIIFLGGSKKSRPPQKVPRNGSKSDCPNKKELYPKFS